MAVHRIYDTTLRDGEQAPGIAIAPERKAELGRELSDFGVSIIDAGFPASSLDERKALALLLEQRRLGRIRQDVEILVMARLLPEEIKRLATALKACKSHPAEVSVLLFTASSPLHMREKLLPQLRQVPGGEALHRDSPSQQLLDANRRMVEEGILTAKELGFGLIEFGAEDASRTNPRELFELVDAAFEAGASRYIFADTVGCLTPEQTRERCTGLVGRYGGSHLVSHFHDDYGLALPNALVAVSCGFRTTATTLCGIGERSGNVAMHTFLVALRDLYGISLPGVNYSGIVKLSRRVAEIVGIPIAENEPVIGSAAFAHESGIHVHGVLLQASLYEMIDPETVGNTRRIVLGKHSGTHAVAYVLGLLTATGGLEVEITEELIQDVRNRLKSSSWLERRNARRDAAFKAWSELDRDRFVTDDELVELVLSLLKPGHG